ncbi:MAG: sensor histidine kinase [Anaerolineales bacterium]
MPVAFQQFFGLLTSPPGNLIYHLVLAFSISSTLPISYFLWKSNLQPLNRRTVLGLGLLLILRIFLFFVGGLVWQGVLIQPLLQVLVERVAGLLSISILFWLWVFPQPERKSDLACLVYTLLLLLSSIFITIWWIVPNHQTIANSVVVERVLSGLSVWTTVLALVLLGWKRPIQWTSGILFFLIVLAGYLIQWVYPANNLELSPYIRFVELAAYPLLILLPLRFPPNVIYPEKKLLPTSGISEKTITANEVALLETSLTLPFDFQSGRLGKALPRLIAQAMRADLCLLVSPPDDKMEIIFHGGYDLIREQNLDGANWDGKIFPTLSAALRYGKTLRLYADTTTPDLENLASLLHLKQAGNLLTTSIFDEQNQPIFGILLISPYSGHRWNSDEQDTLVHIADLLSKLLEYLKKQTETSAQLVEVEQSLIQAQENLAALQQELQIRPMYTVEEVPKPSQTHPMPEQTTLEEELHLALEEIAHLRNELEKAQENQRLARTQARGLEGTTLIANLATELRQPLASILGYTDFLLGESVGILGSLQRKFLERIRSATQRINTILEDYLPETNITSHTALANTQNLDLAQLIQKVMEETEPERQSKNQQLQLDLQGGIPALQMDATGLEQILHKLIENAMQATPSQGLISVKVELKQESSKSHYLLFQIQDQGGGINPEVLPQVFSPARREIPTGLGKSGAELSIVKTLVEALNGRIWIDSSLGSGTTFSILFPFMQFESTPSETGEVAG